MARDFKNRHVNHEDEKKSPASFLAGLLVGLIVAGLFLYFNHFQQQAEPATTSKPLELLPPVEEEVIEVTPIDETTTELAETESESTETTVVEPVYDFYNILPNMEVNVSEWVEEENPATVETEQKPGIYVLQVGSFRKIEAADEVKARLALLGINADIQRVVINGQDIFHRVRIGPYDTANKLEQAQSRLMANDLNFKLLKLTVED